jgi:very-short-patch-repair endonuclease
MLPVGAADDIRRIAERQHGNITRAQLDAIGLTRNEIDERREQGWLIRRHTGVYAVGHVPQSRESRWLAAVLALGDGAVLSHVAAGAHWRILQGTAVIEVIVPTTAGRPKRDGIVVHRQHLPASHVTVHRGIPVTTPIRTLLDLASVLSLGALASAFEQAQVNLHLPPAPLAAEVISRPRQRGNAKLRRILAGAVDPADVRSVLELRFLRLCAAYGIPRPQVNVRIGAWTPDFLWPEMGLVVETDGYEFHRTAAARRRDATKDEFLRSIGLTVIRLTWADVTERPAETAAKMLGCDECRLVLPAGAPDDIRRVRPPSTPARAAARPPVAPSPPA